MKILAFGHRKRVGKSTATRFLVAELRIKYPGINIVTAGFADKVKDVSYQLYAWAGLQPGYFYEDNYLQKEVILPKLGLTPRQIWIGVGNGIRETVGYDGTWLDYLFQTVKADVLIISDLRFPAEADGILKAGGILCKINRPSEPKVTDGADDPLEYYLKWSVIINNDGTLNQFHSNVIKLGEICMMTSSPVSNP